MGKIATCQTRLIALLNADPFFVDNTDPMNPIVKVPVLDKLQGDIASQLDEKLQAIGVGLAVLLRHARLLDSEDHFGLALECQFALTAVANPTVKDDTAPLAYDIVERAAVILQGQPNGVATGDETNPGRFTLDPSAIAPLPDPKRPSLDIELLLLNTTIDLA